MLKKTVAGGDGRWYFSYLGLAEFSDQSGLKTAEVWVRRSRDDGVTWETAEEYDDMSGLVQNVETLVDLDLSPWAGPVRVAFEFDNVCGDAFGVEWGIDDVLICEQNVLPT